MRALRLLEFKHEPEIVEVPEPIPGPGEVVIKVGAAGACHSDLHIMFDFDAAPTMELARSAARAMADVTIVGIAGGELPVSFFSQAYEVSIATTYWGTRPELVELLALAARGDVTVEHTTYSLDDAATAYRDLHAGRVSGRAVIVP